jgi:hypothetical protein
MLTGAPLLLDSEDPEADRAFFRGVLRFRSGDVGGGWLIFELPPAEAALHPPKRKTSQVHAGRSLLGAVLYLICDDLNAQIKHFEAKNVRCTAIDREPWGLKTNHPTPQRRRNRPLPAQPSNRVAPRFRVTG